MKDIWIFVNPIAGRGRGRVIADQLAQRLPGYGFTSHLFTQRADTLPEDALAGQPRVAVVIGGDGTLATVAQRLYLSGDATAHPPLLPIPLGTANLMGRHLGIYWPARTAADHAIAALQGGRIHHIDAAQAGGRLCLLMAHAGFDADVVHKLAQVRRGPISHASYICPAAKALAQYRPSVVKVHLDERQIFDGPGFVFIANIPEYGLGFPLVPSARGDDGLLDVCCVPCRTRADIISLFMRAAGNMLISANGVIHARGRGVRVEADPPLPVQIDGDPAGFTPLDVRLLPFRIPFVVP